MPVSRLVPLCAALWITCGCGSPGPAAPGGSSAGAGLALTCSASTLLAGDLVVCRLAARDQNVSNVAVWTSSDPHVASSEGIGVFVGKSEGQARLIATYSGQSLSAPLAVNLQDVVRVTAAAYQGSFTVGAVVTLWLQGFYGVASAASGTLTLVVTDQTGNTVSASAPMTVAHGGDRYLISTTFTLPKGTTRVCRTAVLQIGSATLNVVPDDSLVPCFAVLP